MKSFRRRWSLPASILALSAAAVVLLTLGATGAGAALTGAGAQKNCDTPKFIGDPVVCTYAFTNQDDFGNNETTNSLVDVSQTAGGAQSSGNIFSSVGWIFDNTPNAGTNPNASPSCVGGSGAGTDASPYFGATQCTVPVSIVNIFGQNFTVGARIRTAPFSWYTSTPADFTLPNHQLSDQGTFTWKCTTGGGSSCDPNANNLANAPATVLLQQRPSNVTTTIHNAAHQAVTVVPVGTTVHDFVHVGSPNPDPNPANAPSGNVNIDWFLNGDCSGTPAANSGSIGPIDKATGNFDATGFSFTVNSAGQRSFKAHYEGDGEYLGSNGDCEPLQVVDANITIAPDKTNAVGDPHTFTVTVNANNGLGGGLQPAAGAAVTVTLTGSNGAAPVPSTPLTGTTDASGHFQVTFTSASAGLVTGNASATLTVAGVSVTRDTDPATANIGAGPGGSGPATKQYVDARILIAPQNATNPTGASHTFTVTVQQDDGLTAAQGGDGVTGFAPAAGAAVTTSIANSNGATSSMTGGTCGAASGLTGSGTTNASGQCTIIITSPTAGVTTANASATFSITGLFNNVSVTRDTDPATANIGAGPGGSGPANKLWILTHVHNAAHADITGTTVTAPATVHDNFTTGTTGTPPGGTVTFTLFQSGNCTGTIVQVGGQNSETVNVGANGSAESTATTLNPAANQAYSYLAHYNGDGTYPAQDASCEPFNVRVADATIAIAPDKTNEVGSAHTFTVTFHSTTGDNITAVNNIVITVSPAPGTGPSACAPLSGLGTPTVTCTTTINSTSAGLFTAHAAADIVLGGATLHRETNGAGGNSGDAQKQYVDARILIAPQNATNPTGASHTFTVTVQYDDGLPAGAPGGDATTGFAAAANAAVTTSIANSNGATSSMTGGTCGNTSGLTGSGTTNASGQCTIIITSPTAGLTTANASATFSITGKFNNVTVTRDTNPATANIGSGPGGSGPASKDWILTHVHDTAHNDITGTTVQGPATVHDQFTDGSTVGGTPPGGSVTFTLFQSGNCTGTIVQVGGQNTQTVNVVNGAAESTAITLNPAADTQYSYLAHYNGDGTFPAADASCEPFTVKSTPQGQITPTQTTCSDFTSGTAQTLGQVNYSAKSGIIQQGINPGVFFFYSTITTTVPNQVVTITQTNTSTNNAALFGILNGQAWLWTGDCVSKIVGTTSNNDANASFVVPTPGTYVISLKYQTKSLAGTVAPVPADITYNFVTSLGGNTGASVLLKKQ